MYEQYFRAHPDVSLDFLHPNPVCKRSNTQRMQQKFRNIYLADRPKKSLLSSTDSALVWRGQEIRGLTEIDLNDSSTATEVPASTFEISWPVLFNLFKQKSGSVDLNLKENVPDSESDLNRNTNHYASYQKHMLYPIGQGHLGDPMDLENPYQISMPPAAYFRDDRPIPASTQFCQNTVNCQIRASKIKAPKQAHSKNDELLMQDDKAQEQVVARKLIKAHLEHLFTENRILDHECLRRKINTTNGGIALSILVKETKLAEYCDGDESVLEGVIRISCDHFLEVLFEEEIYLRPKDWLTIVVSVN